MSARNRELVGLLPAALLLTAVFAGVFIQDKAELTNVSLTYGAIFLGLCLAAHVFIRITLPYADPYLFPLVAVLASFGLVMIYRISSNDARQQAQWFVIGLLLFAATVIVFRDYRKLEQYRYVIVSIPLGPLMLPRFPGPLPGQPTRGNGPGRPSRARAHDPAAQALRSRARDLGHGDGDPVPAVGHRLVVEVLRRVAGNAVGREPGAL